MSIDEGFDAVSAQLDALHAEVNRIMTEQSDAASARITALQAEIDRLQAIIDSQTPPPQLKPEVVTLPIFMAQPTVGVVQSITPATWLNGPIVHTGRILVDGVLFELDDDHSYIPLPEHEGKIVTYESTATNNVGSTVAVSAPSLPVKAAPEQPEPPTGDIMYFAPSARGDGSGSSEANAMSLEGITSLDPYITAVGPGGTIQLLDGQYKGRPIDIRTGGAEGAPVTIRGNIANPKAVYVVGGRNSGTYTDSSGNVKPVVVWQLPDNITGRRAVNSASWGPMGSEFFRLLSGAGYLRFTGFKTERVRRLVNLVANGVHDIEIDHLIGYNNEDHIYQNYANDAGCRNLNVHDCEFIGYPKSAIRFNGKSTGLRVKNVKGNSGWLIGGKFAMGCFISDFASDIIVEGTDMINSLDTQGQTNSAFWNGDGFVTEKDVKNVKFIGCNGNDNSDAGFDNKSLNVYLKNCGAEGNKENFKFWHDGTMETCVSKNPKKSDPDASGPLTGGSGPICQIQAIGGKDVDGVIGQGANIKLKNQCRIEWPASSPGKPWAFAIHSTATKVHNASVTDDGTLIKVNCT